MTLGFGLFTTLSPDMALSNIIAIEVTAGIGVGLLFQAPLLAFQLRMRAEHLAAGTAAFGFVRSMSTTISIVIGSIVFQNGMNRRVQLLKSTKPFELLSDFSGTSAVLNVELISMLDKTDQVAIIAIYAKSLRDLWVLYTSAAAVGLLCSLAIKHEALSTHTVHSTSKLQSPRNESGTAEREATELENLRQA
jgi:hypothetical protein